MNDRDCVQLLQWALPRLGLRWAGFRRVRGQVCKRIRHRMSELGIARPAHYRERLAHDPSEWAILDRLCRVTISRFCRDRGVFDYLRTTLLPGLAADIAGDNDSRRLRCWSAGCASGEEPFTLALIWRFGLGAPAANTGLEIIGTDIDPILLERARRACYPGSSLRELPIEWIRQGFEALGADYCLHPELRREVDFLQQDIRRNAPDGHFHLVFCRNLAFTYFDDPTQRNVLARLHAKLPPAGILVLGTHETVPGEQGLRRLEPNLPIYRKMD